MNYTYEEKYKWLLSKLRIHNIDLWEKDALIGFTVHPYFQFSNSTEPIDTNVDMAIELSMSQERKKNA